MISLIKPAIGTGILLFLVGVLGVALSKNVKQLNSNSVQTSNISLTTAVGQATKKKPQSSRTEHSITHYGAITEKPIFSPTRLPAKSVKSNKKKVKETVSTQDQPPPPLNVKLLGVIQADGVARALVSFQGNESAWIGVGQIVGGWAVSQIGTDWMDLQLNDLRNRVEMYQND